MINTRVNCLLGSIGDDAHSVGLKLIELYLLEKGYNVFSLGIQNSIEDFIESASDFDVILISNINGHSEIYLKDFPKLISPYKHSLLKKKLWLIGGYLSVKETAHDIKKRYLDYGFDEVFPKPVSLEHIQQAISRGIHKKNIKPGGVINKERLSNRYAVNNIDCVNDELFSLSRERVLNSYKAGDDVPRDLYKVANDSIHAQSHLSKLLNHHQQFGNKPLLQPRTGVSNIDEQLTLLKTLSENGLDISSIQLDAATRNKFYHDIENTLDDYDGKQSKLNGFPIPYYGVKGVKRLVKITDSPFQVRGGAPDHRLVYEVALAGGASSLEGGFLSYLLPYDKRTNLQKSLRNWHYIDKLCGLYYQHRKTKINREYFGVLTASLIPPSLAIVINIIETILSLQSGVKSITLGYAEQGNRAQDIAAMQAMLYCTKKYSAFYGLSGEFSTVFHQYMAAFPQDFSLASQLIEQSAITAFHSQASKVMVKTPVEAIKIPSAVENSLAMSLVNQGFEKARDIVIDHRSVMKEFDIICQEVDAIMKAIIGLAHHLGDGAIEAVRRGIIDIPFSPHHNNRGEVITFRDNNGAIRFARFGQLPFNEGLKAFHEQHLQQRQICQSESNLAKILEHDLTFIAKNDHKQWPLCSGSGR